MILRLLLDVALSYERGSLSSHLSLRIRGHDFSRKFIPSHVAHHNSEIIISTIFIYPFHGNRN